MKSVMGPSHSFSQVPKAQIERSSFNRSHGYKTTFDSGWLVPFFLDEALPGDTFNYRLHALARLATPFKPIMDNMFLDTFFFAVPYRLLWEHWQAFNGERTNPSSSTDYVVPTITSPTGGYPVGGLYDYLGLPTGVAGIVHSALPARAYNLIYNEWFRDQNLQDSAAHVINDGPDDFNAYQLQRRGKRHDYFTSCLPWPQKGDAISIPLGTQAPLVVESHFINPGEDPLGVQLDGAVGSKKLQTSNTLLSSFTPVTIGTDGYADLTAATAATINSLRQAFQLQRLLERDARGGSRYTEMIRVHFNVVSPDMRLQRPEYLGGGSTPISITPVSQMAPATATVTTPQGNLAAFGHVTVSGGTNGFTHSFTEHCLVIGLMMVRADLTYQQGMDRMWSRRTRYDHYLPVLAHLGEQPVLTKEIYCDGSATDDVVFGYQERWAEYRYKPSKITGQFRSSFAQSLDFWHLSQDFPSAPVLGPDFIVENPPIARIVELTTEPQFIFDSYAEFTCARPMPVYSVPGMIDHF